jgi:hypothetical protein
VKRNKHDYPNPRGSEAGAADNFNCKEYGDVGMTDRELLELAAKAAKAAGIKLGYKKRRGGFYHNDLDHECCGEPWLPLDCDGDSFELLVKLNLSIKYDTLSDGRIVQVAAPLHESFSDNWWNEWLDDDSKNATRRAIVRAAAEIGRR